MGSRVPAFAALAALAVAVAPVPAAEPFRPVFHPPTLTIRNVRVPTSFRGLDGKPQAPGVYDFEVARTPQGILVGLLRNGKRVGEVAGRLTSVVVDPSDPSGNAADPPGGATKGHDISVRKNAAPRDVHFDVSSKVSFGGGAGKISCSNNPHPNRSNPCWISFDLPAVQMNPGPPERK